MRPLGDINLQQHRFGITIIDVSHLCLLNESSVWVSMILVQMADAASYLHMYYGPEFVAEAVRKWIVTLFLLRLIPNRPSSH